MTENSLEPKKRTISRDLTISLVIVVLLASSLFIFLSYLFSVGRGNALLEQKAQEYSVYIRDSLELSLWNYDTESIIKVGKSYIRNEVISSVLITDVAGQVIFEQVKEDSNDLITKELDIFHREIKIGSIKIGLTTKLYRERIRQMLLSNFLSMLITIIVLVAVTGLLVRLFLRSPFNDLIDGIDQIANGNYDYSFKKVKQWEIKRIISSFNSMVEKIKKRENSLGEINVRLENEIAERKQATEALEVSESRFRLLAENSSDVLWTINLEGRFTYVSPSIENLASYKPEELFGNSIDMVLPPELEKVVTERLQKELELAPPDRSEFATMELQQYTKDRALVDIEVSCSWIRNEKGDPIGVQGITRDITERKQAEKERIQAENALRKSEKQLEKINTCFLEFGPDAKKNIDRLTTLCGELLGASCTLYNRLEDEMLCSIGQWNTPPGYNPVDNPEGHICYDIIKNTDDQVLVVTNLPETHYAQTDVNVKQYNLQTYIGRVVKLFDENVGSLCAVYSNKFEPSDADKWIIEIIASAIGVEEVRQWAEKARKESEDKYRSVLEMSPDPIVAYDTEGKVTYLNPAFSKVLGWTLDELLNKKTDYVPEEEWPETELMIDKVKRGENFSDFETRRLTKSGSIIDVSMSAAVWIDNDGSPLGSVITLRDISEQKRLEANLRYSQKMEAIGRLAGGIAHDFNNILGGIFGFTQLAKLKAPDNPKLHNYLDQIFSASNRASKLVQQILTFSRQTESERIPCDISIVLKEALKLLQVSLPTTIEIRHDIRPDLGAIKADQTQIHQVLMNLCTNAFHAMEEMGGQLNVSLDLVELDKKDIGFYEDLKAGRYLKLTVSDTGCGMNKDTVEHIFEPYFTTRETGEGTGIGLATVHGIVKEHSGFIKVYSELGAGTSIHVFFPRVEVWSKADMPSIESLPTGTERILLVDDEESLADSGKQLLESLGYRVKCETDPIKAIEIFRSNPRDFDLILSDMSMPKITGFNMSKEILNIRDDIPIILCSGFGKMLTTEKMNEIGIRTLLVKPLTMQKLAESVRNELDNK